MYNQQYQIDFYMYIHYKKHFVDDDHWEDWDGNGYDIGDTYS